eukprot:12014159-Ditylum_brightwellii.AAC.1
MAANDATMSPSTTSATTALRLTLSELQITFLVGKHEDINPREKFATLLLLLIACSPSLTLEECGSSDANCAQSITTGANLPFKRNHLDKYCPHYRNKTCSVTQWLITSQLTFYEIKNNGCVSERLAKYRIFMNLTNVKAKRSRVLFFFVFSHGTYSNRKAAHKELMLCLNMTGFDLHSHN